MAWPGSAALRRLWGSLAADATDCSWLLFSVLLRLDDRWPPLDRFFSLEWREGLVSCSGVGRSKCSMDRELGLVSTVRGCN